MRWSTSSPHLGLALGELQIDACSTPAHQLGLGLTESLAAFAHASYKVVDLHDVLLVPDALADPIPDRAKLVIFWIRALGPRSVDIVPMAELLDSPAGTEAHVGGEPLVVTVRRARPEG